jgi:hypothetical protein
MKGHKVSMKSKKNKIGTSEHGAPTVYKYKGGKGSGRANMAPTKATNSN